MVSEQTEWSEDRAEAHRKAKMLREKAPDCPRKTEKQFPRATMDLGPEPVFPFISYAALQDCSPCSRTPVRCLFPGQPLPSPPYTLKCPSRDLCSLYPQLWQEQSHRVYEYSSLDLPNLKLFDFK